MPLPKRLARLNRVTTNRVTRPFAARLPWFGVLHHVGRTSGRKYQTPMNAWHRGDQIVTPLTYGNDVDWLKNAEAAESSVIVIRGHSMTVGRPAVLESAEGMSLMPGVIRPALNLLDVDQFVSFPIL